MIDGISHDDRTGAASDAPHAVQPAHMAGFIVQCNVVVQSRVHASGAKAIWDTPEAEGEKRVADGESKQRHCCCENAYCRDFSGAEAGIQTVAVQTGYDCSGGNNHRNDAGRRNRSSKLRIHDRPR